MSRNSNDWVAIEQDDINKVIEKIEGKLDDSEKWILEELTEKELAIYKAHLMLGVTQLNKGRK